MIRSQLAQPDGTVLNAAQYNEVFTMHGLTMIFLFVMPMSAAFFNYLIPLMIGARDVAFPRLNALCRRPFKIRSGSEKFRLNKSCPQPFALKDCGSMSPAAHDPGWKRTAGKPKSIYPAF